MKGKVNIIGVMVEFILENGKIIKWKAKVSSLITMVMYTKVIIILILFRLIH